MCVKFPILILEEGSLDDTMFQQHGETPHFHKEVMDSLNHKFPEKWTGKGETITWPPRSLDRNPLDFYLVPCMNIPTPKTGALKCVPKHQMAIFLENDCD
jgi:hypothetical protein